MTSPTSPTGPPPWLVPRHGRSALPCCLGFLWMLWDDEDQTWHDKICDTVVIKANSERSPLLSAGAALV